MVNFSRPAILHRRYGVLGAKPRPEDLQYGQIAINYADGRLFILDSGNRIRTFEPSDRGAPDLSLYALKSELAALLGIYKGSNPPSSPVPGLTWLETTDNGYPIMSWQYCPINGQHYWVSNALDKLSYFTGNINSSAALFPTNDYALPYNLLPLYVSGKGQNGQVVRPGGLGSTADSNANYWDFNLKPWPNTGQSPSLAAFKTQGVDWPETGLSMAVLLPCAQFILDTALIASTKNHRTFFLDAKKIGSQAPSLSNFSWTLSFRYVRR